MCKHFGLWDSVASPHHWGCWPQIEGGEPLGSKFFTNLNLVYSDQQSYQIWQKWLNMAIRRFHGQSTKLSHCRSNGFCTVTGVVLPSWMRWGQHLNYSRVALSSVRFSHVTGTFRLQVVDCLVSPKVNAKTLKFLLFKLFNTKTYNFSDPSPAVQSCDISQCIVIGQIFVGIKHGNLQHNHI